MILNLISSNYVIKKMMKKKKVGKYYTIYIASEVIVLSPVFFSFVVNYFYVPTSTSFEWLFNNL